MLRNTAALSRRGFLGAASAFVLTSARARAGGGQRVAALNWASVQGLVALGITPLGIPEVEHYARLAVEPAAPPAVQELGLRSKLNLELLPSLAPDLLVLGEDLAGLACPRRLDDWRRRTCRLLCRGMLLGALCGWSALTLQAMQGSMRDHPGCHWPDLPRNRDQYELFEAGRLFRGFRLLAL